jgi:hypothetical protein
MMLKTAFNGIPTNRTIKSDISARAEPVKTTGSTQSMWRDLGTMILTK